MKLIKFVRTFFTSIGKIFCFFRRLVKRKMRLPVFGESPAALYQPVTIEPVWEPVVVNAEEDLADTFYRQLLDLLMKVRESVEGLTTRSDPAVYLLLLMASLVSD